MPEAAAESPAEPISLATGELLAELLDDGLSRVAGRPLRMRSKAGPGSMLRAELDKLVVEVRDVEITGLAVERVVVHAEHVRVRPGLPPRLLAGPVGFKASVAQDAVDTWTRRAHLPVRLQLTADGVVVRTGFGGISLSEVHAELDVQGPFLSLRPRRASMLGVSTSLVGIFRGYLPLPPLPLGARLARVEHEEGRITAWFALDDVDEPLTPTIARRLRRRLMPRPPLSF